MQTNTTHNLLSGLVGCSLHVYMKEQKPGCRDHFLYSACVLGIGNSYLQLSIVTLTLNYFLFNAKITFENRPTYWFIPGSVNKVIIGFSFLFYFFFFRIEKNPYKKKKKPEKKNGKEKKRKEKRKIVLLSWWCCTKPDLLRDLFDNLNF